MTSEVDRRTEPKERHPRARRANTWTLQRARPVSGTVTGAGGWGGGCGWEEASVGTRV